MIAAVLNYLATEGFAAFSVRWSEEGYDSAHEFRQRYLIAFLKANT